jgi:hypothetical protein
MRVLLPWKRASESRIATTEEVITTLLMEGCFSEELRIESVPWMAGRAMSRSVSSVYFPLSGLLFAIGRERRWPTSLGSGLATWRTPATSFNALSKAPLTVMSGTTTKSTVFLDTKGAIFGWAFSSSMEDSRRTETRTR